MTGIERKLLARTAVLGMLILLGLVAADAAGWLSLLERRLYDLRARHFQFFQPRPTDRLVHLDIDDRTIDLIGRWPWPRSVLAQIVEELRLAQPGPIALDIIFPERTDGTEGADDEDALLADALHQHERVIVPVPTRARMRRTAVQQAAIDLLTRQIELSLPEVHRRLLEAGFDSQAVGQIDDGMFQVMQPIAAARRIDQEMAAGPVTLEALRRRLLRRTDPVFSDSPLLRLLSKQYERVESVRALKPLMRPNADDAPQALPVDIHLPPIAPLAEAAGATGFVDYHPAGDGVVRDIPLFVAYDGKLIPQLGLSLACLTLGVPLEAVRFEPGSVVIPKPDGDLALPVHARKLESVDTTAGLMFDIPWFGPARRWEYMYDHPTHQEPAQHLTIAHIWEVRQWLDRIARNNASADDAMVYLMSKLDEPRARAYLSARPTIDDFAARREHINWTLGEAAAWARALRDMPADELDDDGRRFLAAFDVLPVIVEQNTQFLEQLHRRRTELRRRLEGKSVLIGWIATAAASDFVPTSLHPVCPGVVVHGVVFNAIMTGHVWRRAPRSVNIAVTALVGLLTVACVSLLSPVRAMLACLTLAAGYLLLNGLVLFDRLDLIVGAAGPLLGIAAIWPSCTLMHFVAEKAQRTRIQRRFQSYVDPALVRYVLEHPEQARLDGQLREMTVVFTDLAGFTTLSETLRERTVPMLNAYMGQMVPVIRRYNGYVNKFLGDGIMFFFGAPRHNPHHAGDAVATVLRMQRVMEPFNDMLTKQNLPTLVMRAGISTGVMVVGDAGSEDAADYTVLGDAVNLGARLESANKATGTRVLINERTAELVKAHFLLRPIARLRVVGKSHGVMTFEPLASIDEATPEQQDLARMTAAMVDAFVAGDFQRCRSAAQTLAQQPDQRKLTTIYLELCERYLRDGPPDGFDGSITLAEK